VGRLRRSAPLIKSIVEVGKRQPGLAGNRGHGSGPDFFPASHDDYNAYSVAVLGVAASLPQL
jgi:hypothetical protein